MGPNQDSDPSLFLPHCPHLSLAASCSPAESVLHHCSEAGGLPGPRTEKRSGTQGSLTPRVRVGVGERTRVFRAPRSLAPHPRVASLLHGIRGTLSCPRSGLAGGLGTCDAPTCGASQRASTQGWDRGLRSPIALRWSGTPRLFPAARLELVRSICFKAGSTERAKRVVWVTGKEREKQTRGPVQ